MKFSDINRVDAGTSLTITFVLLIALILGGNGLVIWQFRIVSRQTDRLTGVSQQLLAVQQLQEQLFTLNGRLDEITRTKDASRLVTEARPLLKGVLEQARGARDSFTSLPSDVSTDSLDAIGVTFPAQLEGITALANSGDWEAVNLRLANQLKPMEAEISALVSTMANQVNTQMGQAVATIGNLQKRILLIVPTTTILTFLLAVSFGWFTGRRIVELRMDERVQERTRIARELHDTLLQDVQGLILKIDAIAKRMPKADLARVDIEKTLDYADHVLEEGRDRVRSLRSAPISDSGLPAAFQLLAEELSPDRTATLKTMVEGSIRELHPVILEESYSIGREAILNALNHSHGRNVEVEIIYDPREFRLHIRDDGLGIEQNILDKGGRLDHWGLQGMRERADRIGARFEIWSRRGSGTEIELRIPSSLAYRVPGKADRRVRSAIET